MNYFTSDWHFGDYRMVNGQNLLLRPFANVVEHDWHIYHSFINSDFKDGDTLYHLGDVVFDEGNFNNSLLLKIREKYPNSIFKLVIGNYDESRLVLLKSVFDEIQREYYLEFKKREIAYLNHYPEKCREKMGLGTFGITGHIHGLWKVKKDMINVGVDAWHFKPVSEKQIFFVLNAMRNHYDNNVFL